MADTRKNQTKLQNFKYEIAQEMGLSNKKPFEDNKNNNKDNSKQKGK
ncbi:MAG: small, acid-soluble spore protein, alpha/beta type [Clostridia bacterium]|nr:small, acid-soluble spore protein, alpha/beta type [Clostridia bacterium]